MKRLPKSITTPIPVQQVRDFLQRKKHVSIIDMKQEFKITRYSAWHWLRKAGAIHIARSVYALPVVYAYPNEDKTWGYLIYAGGKQIAASTVQYKTHQKAIDGAWKYVIRHYR